MWALGVFARVVEEQACCGRVCLRVAGFRVYVRGVFVWVFALLGVGALVGWWGSVVVSAPHCARCPSGGWGFGVHASGVGVLVWAVVLCAGLGGKVGRGNVVPPHTAWWCCLLRCVAWGERRGVWVFSWCVDARARRDMGVTGRTVVVWLGVGVIWCERPVASALPGGAVVG